MKRAEETKVNRPKHADYKQQIKKKTNITQKLKAYWKNLLVVLSSVM